MVKVPNLFIIYYIYIKRDEGILRVLRFNSVDRPFRYPFSLNLMKKIRFHNDAEREEVLKLIKLDLGNVNKLTNFESETIMRNLSGSSYVLVMHR